MLLTLEERHKFVSYCRRYSESCRATAEQLQSVPGVGETLAKREKQKAAAYLIVAMDLESVEDQTIS